MDDHENDDTDNELETSLFSAPVIEYKTDVDLYGFAWSNQLSFKDEKVALRFAVGTLKDGTEAAKPGLRNTVELIEVHKGEGDASEEEGTGAKFVPKKTFEIGYPATSLAFINNDQKDDILAITSDRLMLAEVNSDGKMLLFQESRSTCFTKVVWCPTETEHRIGTSSFKEVAIWDPATLKLAWNGGQNTGYRFYDIAFHEKSDSNFVTVNGDGGRVVQFDTRSQTAVSMHTFEEGGAWRIAGYTDKCFAVLQGKNRLKLFDERATNNYLYELLIDEYAVVSGIDYDSGTGGHFTASTLNGEALIWDIGEISSKDRRTQQRISPALHYWDENIPREERALTNIAWSQARTNYIGVVGQKLVKLLHVAI